MLPTYNPVVHTFVSSVTWCPMEIGVRCGSLTSVREAEASALSEG